MADTQIMCDLSDYPDLRAMNIYDPTALGVYCPVYSTFFGVMGTSASMYLCAIGAAYGTAKCGTGLAMMAVQFPQLVLKNIIPVVMASVIAIYGLVVSVLIANGMAGSASGYSVIHGYIDLSAGITTGLAGVASGWATAITGEVGVRCVCHQPKYFVGMILTLIFAGVMGLYGLIVALTLRTSAGTIDCFAECFNPCCPNGQCAIVANLCPTV